MTENKFEKAEKVPFVHINWDKVFERYLKEIKKSQKRNIQPAREFAHWLNKNQDILPEFQNEKKQYLMNAKDEVSAMFDFEVCSGCTHCRIRRDVK